MPRAAHQPVHIPAGQGRPTPAAATGPMIDPRIGSPLRTGSVFALLLPLASGMATAPTLTVLAAVLLITLARTVDLSMTSLIVRRHEFGARRQDLPLAVVTSPWHLAVGAIRALTGVLVPIIVGSMAAVTTSVAMLLATGTNPGAGAPLPLAVGGAIGGLMAWFGPDSASLRRGTRSLIRGLTPTSGAQVTFVSLLVVSSLVLVWLAWQSASGPTWAPVSPPDTWIGG